jgi:hypothetical protein
MTDDQKTDGYSVPFQQHAQYMMAVLKVTFVELLTKQAVRKKY